MQDRVFDFIGDHAGQWKVVEQNTITGLSVDSIPFLTVEPGSLTKSDKGAWALKGIESNMRYTRKEERDVLLTKQEGLGRNEATYAAMIPIRKAGGWWELAQDERRQILEEKSHHIKIGLEYLPAIARKLYHCHDLSEPFDFITWFEYSPENLNLFEELLEQLRETEEWKYVDREIDFRLVSERK